MSNYNENSCFRNIKYKADSIAFHICICTQHFHSTSINICKIFKITHGYIIQGDRMHLLNTLIDKSFQNERISSYYALIIRNRKKKCVTSSLKGRYNRFICDIQRIHMRCTYEQLCVIVGMRVCLCWAILTRQVVVEDHLL